MTLPRFILVAALLAFGPTQAQSPANAEEIAFWETVRDSKNPAELQAYIDNYPNGRFVVLAKSRLAALQRAAPAAPARSPSQRVAPPPQASVASQSYAAGVRVPQPGDTWTYRLSYPKRFGVPLPTPSVRTHIVRVDSSTSGEIVDQVLVDGAPASGSRHVPGAHLLTQGVSIFSPYLVAFGDLAPGARLGSVSIQESSCRTTHACVASARVVGTETVQVPAGTFNAVRIVVDQSWRPGPSASQFGQHQMATLNGGRTITVWYAPEVKRAVKISSRHGVGETPPVDTHFDLELVSYQLK
jgi:hypothetical protein